MRLSPNLRAAHREEGSIPSFTQMLLIANPRPQPRGLEAPSLPKKYVEPLWRFCHQSGLAK
jgi:hypothetical protein